ncbi:isoprenylcysteine carboxylmethyltransferase family protein [Rhizobium leguminosarum]|uniref:isoprenylcysteine carboxylmethyltransferase family protein n=1 Tax=Rhizobium leguminosarum TaxID=384 RepID=UPI0004871E1B|nr:isoprenylcysteine carboxylmethyltransferase family protein [Rhizobium leguminosarum]
MPNYLIAFVFAAFAWRIFTVVVSTRNEIALKRRGAKEVGALNSIALAVAHLAFYITATIEGAHLGSEISFAVSSIGIVLYVLAAIALVSVMRSLRDIWTVKIMIDKAHPLVRTGLFAWVRHPNYFVSILPELFAFAMALNAYWTMILGLPLYLIPLSIRIRQEEAAMRRAVSGY